MNNGRGYLLTCTLCMVLLLSGCSGAWEATKKVGKVVMDSDIPVGPASDQPSTVRLILLAEPDMNPNEKGDATPIEVAVVYLSENSKLLAADYDQLTRETLEKTLGKNYIDHQEYTLLPAQFKPMNPIKLADNNSYLGVIAYYADADRSEWKKIIKVKGIGHHYNVLVHVRANDIELRKEEE
ncbi:type VI secretion system lipoprotein TssJ [Yersinia pekkanenii]|uniref:Lipoprotein n=1 Tax=Yersinia pekkanenii TaxID=1288385 RepID=A0A0T9PNF0_9GAMM|nr:type VI secretion system lipoprotein TssJ [Yersinia pekkanenii]CNH73784.1 putative lipoprotein [Yersinia pekkanenii]CRY68033.1 putative lipoprotein [Yersinia pekkanenii]